MRFASLLLLAAACAAGPRADHRPADRPQPLVVFVHGRGQLGADTALLRREWKHNLDASLAGAKAPLLADDNVRLVWYADVLDPSARNECAAPAKPVEEMDFGDLARGLFSSLTDLTDGREGDDARGLMGEVLYFLDDSMRCGTRRRLAREIQSALDANRPVIVVAYSLGAMVAYDYLRTTALPAGAPDIHLVTVGSLLGAREIRNLLFGDGGRSPSLPSGVSSWVNVYDPSDPFAAPFGVAAIEDRRTTTSHDGNAHYVGRYLRGPATASAVRRALCLAAGNPAADCSSQ